MDDYTFAPRNAGRLSLVAGHWLASPVVGGVVFVLLVVNDVRKVCTRGARGDGGFVISGALFRRLASIGGGSSGFGLCLGVRKDFSTGFQSKFRRNTFGVHRLHVRVGKGVGG